MQSEEEEGGLGRMKVFSLDYKFHNYLSRDIINFH